MSAGESQPNDVSSRTRDGKGRYDRSIDTVERDAEAARLKAKSWSYQQIADHLGITKSSAFEAVQRAYAEVITEPAENARKVEIDRYDQSLRNLDAMREMVLDLLKRRHYTVSNGRVVHLDDEPLEDDGFVLSCVDRLNSIESQRNAVAGRRAKLMGLDIPVKQEVELTTGVEYRLVGVMPEALR